MQNHEENSVTSDQEDWKEKYLAAIAQNDFSMELYENDDDEFLNCPRIERFFNGYDSSEYDSDNNTIADIENDDEDEDEEKKSVQTRKNSQVITVNRTMLKSTKMKS